MTTNDFQGIKGTIYMRNVPRHIRNEFNAACARRGKKMKPVILAFMVAFAKRDRELNQQKNATEAVLLKFKPKKKVKK